MDPHSFFLRLVCYSFGGTEEWKAPLFGRWSCEAMAVSFAPMSAEARVYLVIPHSWLRFRYSSFQQQGETPNQSCFINLSTSSTIQCIILYPHHSYIRLYHLISYIILINLRSPSERCRLRCLSFNDGMRRMGHRCQRKKTKPWFSWMFRMSQSCS